MLGVARMPGRGQRALRGAAPAAEIVELESADSDAGADSAEEASAAGGDLDAQDADGSGGSGGGSGDEDEDEDEDEELAGNEAAAARPDGRGKNVKGPINMKKLQKFQDKLEKTGVVYLSRVPPYMKAQKVRHLLSQYGELGRIYLTPEDPAIRKKRKAMGGNKKQSFVDGWIEFADKSVAKRVAKTLNATPIGGKSTSFYSSDLWNLKYLSKFKWNHLTEKVAYDNQVRKQKLLAEIAQAKRERDFYMDKAEEHKHRERILKKQKTLEDAQPAQGVGDAEPPPRKKKKHGSGSGTASAGRQVRVACIGLDFGSNSTSCICCARVAAPHPYHFGLFCVYLHADLHTYIGSYVQAAAVVARGQQRGGCTWCRRRGGSSERQDAQRARHGLWQVGS